MLSALEAKGQWHLAEQLFFVMLAKTKVIVEVLFHFFQTSWPEYGETFFFVFFSFRSKLGDESLRKNALDELLESLDIWQMNG